MTVTADPEFAEAEEQGPAGDAEVTVDLTESPTPRPLRWPSPLAIAAVASIGAGGIHASVIGAHGEHRFLATMFVWVAAFQVAWGIATLLRPSVELTSIGVVGHMTIAMAWLVTRLTGVSFVDGLEVREKVQFADASAAFLALVAVALAFGTLLVRAAAAPNRLTNLSIPAFCCAALALPAMVTGGTHLHSEGHTETVTATHAHDAAAESHGVTGSPSSVSVIPASDIPTAGTVTATTHGHPPTTIAAPPVSGSGSATTVVPVTEPPAVVPPKPYDPTKPIDLSGVDGVSEEQQARAENLIAITLNRLPKFADYTVAESLGWHSIGDGFLGYEHFLNPSLFADGRMLDPDFPESLVYRIDNGKRTLVSAMFMAEPGISLQDVPEVGGRLTQWHIHNNLCFTTPEQGGRVAGLTNADGTCTAPLVKGPELPMIHVWIVPHPCGPFAALEGAAAGQILPGEERWCDHAHGATG